MSNLPMPYKLEIYDDKNHQWKDHPSNKTFLSRYAAKAYAKHLGLEFGQYRATEITIKTKSEYV